MTVTAKQEKFAQYLKQHSAFITGCMSQDYINWDSLRSGYRTIFTTAEAYYLVKYAHVQVWLAPR